MLDGLQGRHGGWHVATQLLAAGGQWRHGGQAKETHDDGEDSIPQRMPMAGEHRLADWLTLVGFHIEKSVFGFVTTILRTLPSNPHPGKAV